MVCKISEVKVLYYNNDSQIHQNKQTKRLYKIWTTKLPIAEAQYVNNTCFIETVRADYATNCKCATNALLYHCVT